MSNFTFAISEIAQFIRRSGNIDLNFLTTKRMHLGSVIHTVTQSKHKKIYEKKGYIYESEFPLNFEYKINHITLRLCGRADAIISNSDELIICELKSTKTKLKDILFDENHWHFIQICIYGFIASYQNNKKDVALWLCYINSDTFEEKLFSNVYSFAQLEKFFLEYMNDFFVYLDLANTSLENAISTGNNINFPFENYRDNQRDLLVAVYSTIQNERLLFAQAPTGVGKTISTLFPAIKALCGEYTKKIFYSTAKNITRTVAEDTLRLLNDNGLKITSVTISAKEKICLNDKVDCNPNNCKYAKGHFDRVNNAIVDIISNENIIDFNILQQYANKHTICPFEFSLDISIFSQIVICDYNYIYNPKTYLKRYFSTNSDYTILIDEAHNLDDRVCDMYSASTNLNEHLKIRELIHSEYNDDEFDNLIEAVEMFFEKTNNNYLQDKNELAINYPLNLLVSHFEKIIKFFNNWLDSGIYIKKEVLDQVLIYYFHLGDFVRIFDFYNDCYKTVISKNNNNISIEYLCIDPSFAIKEINSFTRSTIFFSATLSPLIYYRDIYGGSSLDYSIDIPSPFPVDKSVYIVDNSVNTYYKHRSSSYKIIVDRIYNMIVDNGGNYLIFFSSFDYLNNVFDLFVEKYPNINCISQTPIMNEDERNHFLSKFVDNKTGDYLIGFAVLGGVFGEGIDLKGYRLIGVGVVGVGLPMITFNRNVKKDYFDKSNGKGFEFAYTYPAMNKVNQSIGRLIRTDSDVGVVLLMDMRYSQKEYMSLIHTHNKKVITVNSNDSLRNAVNNFWDNLEQ